MEMVSARLQVLRNILKELKVLSPVKVSSKEELAQFLIGKDNKS